MTLDPIQERMDFGGAEPRLRPRGTAPEVAVVARRLAVALRLERALAFLDLESTGLNPERDRIVEISIVRLEPDGRIERLETLIDPGADIPPESSRIHGLDQAAVAGAPTFAEVSSRILRLLRGADLAGYNVDRFDLPLLRAELDRAGHAPGWSPGRIVDACRIFKRMERRDLGAAFRFYCEGSPPPPHTAAGDVAATMQVLAGQLDRYPEVPRTVDGLEELSRPPSSRA